MNKIQFTKEQEQLIIKLYTEQRLSLAKIGKMFKVSKIPIKRVLISNNIPLKDNHTYFADYDKFKKIDNPDKAYWLGFIAADGNVLLRQNSGTLRIGVHTKDREHLEKFKDFMLSNANIQDFINFSGYSNINGTPMSQICLNSLSMVKDLISLNIVPNKSLILKPPNIEEKYYYAFLLGLFDGDGSIFKTKNNQFGFNLIGSFDIISWANKVLKLNAPLEQRFIKSKTYYIRCGGTKKVYNLLYPLYNSCDTHLTRKYLLFKELESRL